MEAVENSSFTTENVHHGFMEQELQAQHAGPSNAPSLAGGIWVESRGEDESHETQ